MISLPYLSDPGLGALLIVLLLLSFMVLLAFLIVQGVGFHLIVHQSLSL